MIASQSTLIRILFLITIITGSCIFSVSAQNTIQNAEFDSGTTNWTLADYTGPGNTNGGNSFSTVTGAGLSGTNSLFVDVVNAHNGGWNLNIKQTLGISLQVGRTYSISIMAKAQSSRTMDLTLAGFSNTAYWSTLVNLTTSVQTFNYTYTCNNSGVSGETGFRVMFMLAKGVISDVWIDRVWVEDITGMVPVSSVSVSPATLSIAAGSTSQLTHTVSPANATNQNVTWTSSNTGVATVNSSGLVTAVAAGSATITATTVNLGKTATSSVTVTSNVPVTGVSVSPSSRTLASGQTVQLTRTISPTNATNQNVTWSSNNTGVATVNSSGVVTGISAGSANITATAIDGGFTASAAIEVLAPGANGILNAEFDLGTSNWTLADYTGAGYTNGGNSYTVVSGAGLSGTNSLFVDVVNANNGGWTLQVRQPLPFTLEVGRTYAISFMAKAQSARTMNVSIGGTSNTEYYNAQQNLTTGVQTFNYTYTCNNAGVNSETGFQVLFLLAKGVISDVWIDKVIVEDITGIVAVTSVSVSPTTLSLDVGTTGQLTKTISPANATNQNVNWSSSNTAVATVNSTGLVTGVAVGSATITAITENSGKTASTSVTIANNPVTGISVSPASLSLTPGQVAQITRSITPSNATNQNVDWSSSNTAVATVSSTGQVTAVAEGSATITATTVSGGFTASTSLVVLPPGSNLILNPEFDQGVTNWTLADYTGPNYTNGGNSYSVVTNANMSGANALMVDVVNANNGGWTLQVRQSLGFRIATGRTYAISIMAKAQSSRTMNISIGGTSNTEYYNAQPNLTTSLQTFSYTWTPSNSNINNETGFNFLFLLAKGVMSDVWIDKVVLEDITGIVPVTGVSLSPNPLAINTGETGQLTKTITPSNATNQNVSWTSSNTSVATVNSSGLVTGVSAGSVTITATTQNSGKTATTTVNVTDVAVTGVELLPSTVSLSSGQTVQLNKTITPSNATNQNVTWTSGDPAIATVNASGLVTAVSPGSTTVTVTTLSGNLTDISTVTVNGVTTVIGAIEQFAFQYDYDSRKRMTHKKVPGTAWLYMVYDDRDRLVMTQDGNQRSKSPREWTFTKYDALNRPVLTGTYLDNDNFDQPVMQIVIDAFYNGAAEEDFYEVRGTDVHGYSNRTFPVVSAEDAYLTVTYFDDYSFKSLIGATPSDYDYDNTRLVASGDDKAQDQTAFMRVQGQVTGAKTKNLDTNGWLWTVNYFDDHYRPIQMITQNHKGGLDKTTSTYDFVGKVLRTKTDHSVNGGTPVTTARKMTYDHAGRLLQTDHRTNNGPAVTLSKNEYNELGQLITKSLHSRLGSEFKQRLDYRYNIRGWLTAINDLEGLTDEGPRDYFMMDLYYEAPPILATPQYNANISSIMYLNTPYFSDLEDPQDGDFFRVNLYEYDPMNRLMGGGNVNIFNPQGPFVEYAEGLEYDLNGNITELTRFGKGGSEIDDLSYAYIGNQVTGVTDQGADDEGEYDKGFIDGNTEGNDYLYDANGNMVTDKNKDITAIEYNHLNLPRKVTKANGEYLKYIYNAAGVKLSQEVYNASNVLQKKSDYLGEFFYEEDALIFINHEEGRVVMAENEPEYQYFLKDHLGNNRITFTTKSSEDTFTATLEDNTQTEEQNTFGNYSRITNNALDHTDAGSQYDKVLILNGGLNGQVGLAKSFAVVPGDTITASVYVKYMDATSNQGNLAALGAALTSAFGLNPGVPTEALPFEALNSLGSVLATAGRDDDDDGAPKGFLNILVFDQDYNLIDFAFEQIDVESNQSAPHELMTSQAIIRKAGYVYVFLSNEGAVEQQIAFDDYTITHTHSPVIQQEEYYPFGLTFNSYQRENSVKNRWKFQGQEHVDDLGLNWDSFKWRNHQADIGRFFNVDPLSEKYYYNSPYAFSENKVVAHIELEGLESIAFFARPAPLFARPNVRPVVETVVKTQTGKPTWNPKSSVTENIQNLFRTGKNAHLERQAKWAEEGIKPEQYLGKENRVDGLKIERITEGLKGTLRELKPDSKTGRIEGLKQLERYVEAAIKQYPEVTEWHPQLELYRTLAPTDATTVSSQRRLSPQELEQNQQNMKEQDAKNEYRKAMQQHQKALNKAVENGSLILN